MWKKIIIILCIIILLVRWGLLPFLSPQTFAASPFTFTVTSDNNWGSGFCYQFTTQNTSTSPVSDWVIGFELVWGTITSSFGWTYTQSGSSYEIRTPGAYADPLASGASVNMWFCGTGSTSTVVSWLELKSYAGSEWWPTPPWTLLEDYSILFDEFQLDITTNSQYTGGYCRNINIENTWNSTINGWKLDFTLDQELTSSYSWVFSKSGPQHTINPLAYNENITPWQSHTLWFCSEGNKFDYDWIITVDGRSSPIIQVGWSNIIGTGSVTGTWFYNSDIIWDSNFPWSASGAVSDIKISAQVSPSLNLIISDSAINLGSLTADIPASWSLSLEVGTNARSGVSLTAKSQSWGLTNTWNNFYQINNLTTDSLAESYTWKSEINLIYDSSALWYFAENSSWNSLENFVEIYENTTEYNMYTTNKGEALSEVDDVEFILQTQVNAQTPAGEYEDTIHFTITGNF